MTSPTYKALLTAVALAGLAGLGWQADAVITAAAAKAAAKDALAKKTGKKAEKKKTGKSAPTKTANVPLPRPRPGSSVTAPKAAVATREEAPERVETPPPRPAVTNTSSIDVAALKQAIAHARSGKIDEATQIERSISDPVSRKLVEWAILRTDNGNVAFARYPAFINANPGWPSIGFLRRRAEGMLWQEHVDISTVRSFFAKEQPVSAKGRFALARALLAAGDRGAAQAQVRAAWYNEGFGSELESQALEAFGDMLTPADHKARMDMRLYADDVEGGMRSANRVGGVAIEIAKVRAAVIKKAGNAKTLLDSASKEAKQDIGYVFSYVQWLRRGNHAEEAADAIIAVPRATGVAIDANQWWVERRLVARKLLDLGDVRKAYLVTRDAVPPTKENQRIEAHFTAGWIALRFLNDPAAAQQHFALMAAGVSNPISLGRAGYWQGRAAEAMGRQSEARAHYQSAAQFPTGYYGQIARARLGMKDMVLRGPPDHGSATDHEIAYAAEILYAIGERDLVTTMSADLGERSNDVAALAAIGDASARNRDARAMLHVGKAALARGLPLEHFAFPTIGIPDYHAIGPNVELGVVYAIARQESTFNPRIISSARALGLMQVTPGAGRYIARKYNVAFNEKRLLSDPVYNVQMGSAELGGLIQDYRGSYILTFAGYNAGRGRVREWIEKYGDPRDPKVDPIDWVERIPFSETRNYVQRVMENVQVYRVRFGGGAKLMIEADLHRGAVAN